MVGYNKYNVGDHDTVIINTEKIDTLQKTCNRIENKLDGINKRVDGKIGWIQLGIVAAIIGAGWKYAIAAVAAVAALF